MKPYAGVNILEKVTNIEVKVSLHELYELNAVGVVVHVRVLYLDTTEEILFIFIVEGLRC